MIRAPYTAVFRIFAGSRSAGINTQASIPCCAHCAATALARFPVDEQPMVVNPKCRAAAKAVATTRSLNESEGKHTASFLIYRFFTPHLAASLPDRSSGVPPIAKEGVNPTGSGSSSEYRHMLNA